MTTLSYLGGTVWEHARDITTDSSGNFYVTGGTTSRDFPVTDGAYQTTLGQGLSPDDKDISPVDVFIIKFNSSGSRICATYLGGRNYDRAYAIEVDADGDIYVAGRAGAGFPVTTGALQTSHQGGQEADFYGPQDGFVAKLSGDCTTLHWATYFGANDPWIVRDIAIDPSTEDVFLASSAQGTYPAAISAAFTNANSGGVDAVFARLNNNGASLDWATYIGGEGRESGQNSVRYVGRFLHGLFAAASTSGIATAGAYDTTHAGGTSDYVLTSINPTTGTKNWATYYGGAGTEGLETHELIIDSNGISYVVANTTSGTGFPTTGGAFDTSYNGGRFDVVVGKFSADGASLLASTFLGGSGRDAAEGGGGIDNEGRLYFAGATTSTDYPTTAGAFDISFNGGGTPGDCFVTVLHSDLASLDYSTYVGGTNLEDCRAAALDASMGFIFGGEVNSSDLPVTSAFDSTYNTNNDSWFGRLQFTLLGGGMGLNIRGKP